jgi:hypothetical protein
MSTTLSTLADAHDDAFRSREAAHEAIEAACAGVDDATLHEIGTSEEGRPILGAVVGTGDQTVSLIAGNHADEPVGPETLRTLLADGLGAPDVWGDVRERFRFVIVPHTNPDGEARNRPWIDRWPDPVAYLRHVVREAPGRDLEFGFPAMRPENEHVSAFLRAHGPYALHMSLHGMATAEGAQLLINRPWTFRTEALQAGFRAAAGDAGLRMHDHNRQGEKGFFYIGPGFTTTPRGDAMRTFFHAQNDPDMAARFHQSSMEFVMGLGGDPLALVTELPLFVVPNDDPTPGVPERHLALKAKLPAMKRRLAADEPVDDLLAPFDLRPLPVPAAMRLQLRALELGLETVAADRS